MIRRFTVLAVFASFFWVISFAGATTHEVNLSVEEQATVCLNESMNIFSELINNNFSVNRVNDTLKQAEDSYNAQILLMTKRQRYDFSMVVELCQQIKTVRDDAFLAKDEITALIKFYNETFEDTEEINTTNIESLFVEINTEMGNERYEKIPELVEKAYDEIVNVQSENTTLKIFYKSTARGIKNFIINNWILLLSLVVGGTVLFVIYKKAIYHWIIIRKISLLELRKQTLKKMIMRTQKDYFQYGKVSEGEYTIKTKKLAELIRDIDRQIPLLREELAKIGKMETEQKK